MPGFFTDPKALESQQVERAEIEARRRSYRTDVTRQSERVAARIRADYEDRLATPQGFDGASLHQGYRPPYPWQVS